MITWKPASVHGPNDVTSDVRGVTPARHQDASDAWRVVARVECLPASAEVNLKPSAEIHRRTVRGHTDVAKVTGAIACRNIHVTAQRNRKVSEVATHTGSFGISIPGGFGWAGVLVTERYMIANVVTDRFH